MFSFVSSTLRATEPKTSVKVGESYDLAPVRKREAQISHEQNARTANAEITNSWLTMSE